MNDFYLKNLRLNSKKKKKYVRESQGGAAIEFALTFPLFFLTFMGIFELGAIMFVQTTLERAVLNISRFGRTGNIVPGETPQETAQSLLSTATFNFLLLDPAKVVLTVTPYERFSDIPPLAEVPQTGAQNFGGSKQPVIYTLSYQWTLFTPFVGQYLLPNGNSINLTASSIIQNEPF